MDGVLSIATAVLAGAAAPAVRRGARALGELLARDRRVTVTDTVTGQSSVMVIADNALNGPYGQAVDVWSAGMSIPACWRASTLIADLLAGFPWHAYTDVPGQPSERIPQTPPVLEQPHPPFERIDSVSAWTLDLLWNGNAIGVIADRDPVTAVPTAVVGVAAAGVQVRRNRSTGRIEYKIGAEVWDQDEVMHVRGPHRPGELRGKGVLEVHTETLALAREQRKQAGGLATAGVPTGIITSADPKLDETGAGELKSRWLTALVTRQPMVVNPQTTWQSVAWDAEELQLVEARKLSNSEAALLFGMPASLLNLEGPSRTYSNVRDEHRQLLLFSPVGGHLARFEAAFSRLLPRGIRAAANLDALMRPDTPERYQAHESGIRAGWLKRSEVRATENLPAIPGIDDPPAQPAPPPPPTDPPTDPTEEE